MPVQLKSEAKLGIPMNQLEDGQLGIVVECSHPESIGRVVQMMKMGFGIERDVVITIGRPNGSTYSKPISPSIRVRPLEAGELIEVLSN